MTRGLTTAGAMTRSYEGHESDHGWEIAHIEGCTDTLTLYGKELRMVQFHFHTPSENTLNGRYAPI
jgi:hypothetical protein